MFRDRIVPNHCCHIVLYVSLIPEEFERAREIIMSAVELEKDDSLQLLTKALLRAEINIHYVYSFMHQPNGKPVIAIAMEDEDTAVDVLQSYHLRVLSQDELIR